LRSDAAGEVRGGAWVTRAPGPRHGTAQGYPPMGAADAAAAQAAVRRRRRAESATTTVKIFGYSHNAS